MSLPKVSVLYANGGLLQDIEALDGIACLVGTGSTSGLIGVPKVVYSLADAESKGYTEDAEPVAHRHLKEFYNEVGGNQELYIMLVPETMTMAQMVTNTEANGAKKALALSNGRVRLLGIFRTPGEGYAPGSGFFDADVASALTTSKVFAEARLAELTPVRILIEGRVTDAEANNTLQPRESGNGFAGVVAGGTLDDGSASVGLALGRAVKFGAEIKLGKVANGPLSITSCFIGDTPVNEFAGLATLHGAGFISFLQHPNKAGYYFGIDRMASTDDYRLLAYGRVVDKAAIIAAAVYIEDLEGEVDVDANGNIDSLALSAMEARIAQQLNVAMATQISGLEVYINPAQNIINTGTLTVQLRVRPKGYKSFINIDLGLIAPNNA
jgi:hypothetical protein